MSQCLLVPGMIFNLVVCNIIHNLYTGPNSISVIQCKATCVSKFCFYSCSIVCGGCFYAEVELNKDISEMEDTVSLAESTVNNIDTQVWLACSKSRDLIS